MTYNWKNITLATYLCICVFDFVIVPSWIGLFRDDVAFVFSSIPQDAPVQVQMEYLKLLTQQHQPFTLRGGGLFHLSFGAILTGGILSKESK